jgi:streptomycin 6-kinase
MISAPSAVLANLRSDPRLAAVADQWAAGLPAHAQRLAGQWNITFGGDPLPDGGWGVVAPCVTADGRHAVLKLCADDRRIAAEHTALTAWRDAPAADVLAFEPGAMLIERLQPATELNVDAAQQAELLRALHGSRVDTMSELYPFRERTVQRSVRRIRQLAGATHPQIAEYADLLAADVLRLAAGVKVTVCHGDLHAGNVLDHHGRPTVIDPFGVIGPAELDVANCAVNFAAAGDDLRASVTDLAVSTGADVTLSVTFARMYALLEAVHHTVMRTRHADRSAFLFAFAYGQ